MNICITTPGVREQQLFRRLYVWQHDFRVCKVSQRCLLRRNKLTGTMDEPHRPVLSEAWRRQARLETNSSSLLT